MENIMRIEDSSGNAYYPQTKAKATFMEDGKTVETKITQLNESLSHKNILDNPWFTINQRGKSSYSGSMIYTLDRWILASGSANISANGVTVNGTPDFFQKHELGTFEVGKTYTFSAIVDNVLRTWTFEWKEAQQFSGDLWGWQFSVLNNWYGFNFISINIPNKNEHTIKAIKLELGTVSTLHLDPPPKTQQELAKCQRYFVRFNYAQYAAIGITSSDANYIMFPLSLATPMRTVPTVTITCTLTRVVDAYQLTNIGINSINNGTIILGSSHSGTPIVSTLMASTAGYIDLSAEL